ncbi:MAG TPA: serine/threonine-protein kinase, partial [Polyangium sp.]|nr:serine/threonine-protein kinase [Polyangium sp.]
MTETLRAVGAPDPALAPTVAAPTPQEGVSPPAEVQARRVDGAPTLGRFLLLRKLGEGGMGEVFSAYDEQLDRRVAIKLLHAAYAPEETQKRMFREAQALARLSHPNVVTVYEVGEVDGDVFVVMEHIEGKTLQEWQEEAPRSAEEVLEAYRMAGRGLAAVHAAGMVHRDVKPANAMIDGDGRVRILDFGLAHARGVAPADPSAAAPTSGALASPLTAEGSIVGTPAYMSPEQFLGDPLDARSDQFSFCVALYEALYQRNPFAPKKPGMPVIPALAGEPAPAPSRGDVPARVPEALARGLARDPAGRFESMEALLAKLDEEPAVDPSGQGRQRRLFAV